jgi:hypothetical protein
MPSGGITLKVSSQSAELLRETYEKTGALVVGRRPFDLAGGWAADTPWTCRSSSLLIQHPKSGSMKDRCSPSSRTASGAPSRGRKRCPAIGTWAWAASEEIESVEFVRVEYDLERAVEGILGSELPHEFADQLRTGRTPKLVEVA